MKTKAVKVLCLVLVVMLTFSAISPLAAEGEEYVDNEAYIGQEQEELEPAAEASVEDDEYDNIPTPNPPSEMEIVISLLDMEIISADYWLDCADDTIMALSSADLPVLRVFASMETTNSVRLTWNLDSGDSGLVGRRGFWVRADGDDFVRHVYVDNITDTFTVTVMDLVPDTLYHVRAIAEVTGYTGTRQSPAITFRTLSTGGTQPSAPGIPGNFVAVPGNEIVNLSWNPPTSTGGSPIVGYQVSNNGGVSWRFVPAPNTTYPFDGLINGTRYTFWVRAVNQAGAEGNHAIDHATPIAVGGFDVSQRWWSAAAGADSITVQVEAMGAWTATSNNPSWLFVNGGIAANGTSDGSFTISVAPNPNPIVRPGSITVTSGGVNIRIDVDQAAAIGVTLNGNDGTINGQDTVIIAMGDPLPTPYRTGYRFGGWYTGRTFGIEAGRAPIRDGDRFYARWLINITLDPAEGTFNGSNTPIIIERLSGMRMDEIDVPMPPPRTGYGINGWFTDNGVAMTEESFVPNEHITLTAEWGLIWHSVPAIDYQGNEIPEWLGFWPGTINVYAETIGSASDSFEFNTRVHEARLAWAEALGIPILSTGVESIAQIRMYSGSRDTVWRRFGEDFPEYAGWATRPTRNPHDTIFAGGETRNVDILSGYSRAIVIERTADGAQSEEHVRNIVRNVTMHEMGHALGYGGHSPTRQDVMGGGGAHTGTTLGRNEIRHLKQVYERFRR